MSQATDRIVLPGFTEKDFADKSSGEYVPMTPEFVNRFSALLKKLGVSRKDVDIHSAYRTAAHNAEVGGVSDSQHLKSTALDLSIKGYSVLQIEQAAKSVGFTGLGGYVSGREPARQFAHIDVRPGGVQAWGDYEKQIESNSSGEISQGLGGVGGNAAGNVSGTLSDIGGNASAVSSNKFSGLVSSGVTGVVVVAVFLVIMFLVLNSVKPQEVMNIVKEGG